MSVNTNCINKIPFTIQRVRSHTVTHITTATVIPVDDTIPQQSEGLEILTATITPTSATSILEVEFNGYVEGDTAAGNVVMALFRDATANAVDAAATSIYANGAAYTMSMKYWTSSASTSSTTFKIRMGTGGAGNVALNGTVGSRRFGGVSAADITVTEYLA